MSDIKVDAVKGETVNYRYLDIPLDRSTIFATREDQAAALKRLYPSYEPTQEDESMLWHWIEAVAQEAGVSHDEAKHLLNRAADPIFSDNAEVVGRWVFFLA
jgi:hypothetical protein